MKKKDFENELIEAWLPLFERYPELNAIPVYAWGRFYKYECAGDPFEDCVDEHGFNGFRHNDIQDIEFDWTLLKQIDELHNKQGSEIWNGEWGDYLPDREEVRKLYNFDERFGRCLVIEKKEGNLELNMYICGSRE